MSQLKSYNTAKDEFSLLLTLQYLLLSSENTAANQTRPHAKKIRLACHFGLAYQTFPNPILGSPL